MTQSDRQALIDMGFTEAKVTRALKATKNAGLQPAMDWLFTHADEPDTVEEDAQGSTTAATTGGPSDDADDEISAEQATAQSLKCDDCGTHLRDANAAERHAMKTQHVNFSESTQAVKPLTAEEKAAKLKSLQALLASRREAKRQQEADEAKAREKVRRRTGQEMVALKEAMEAKAMQKALDAKRREKEDERLARERVKAQLDADKRERQRKADERKRLAASQDSLGIQNSKIDDVVVASSSPVVASSSVAAKSYTETRLQIRAPAGQTLTHTFQADDTLATVYAFLQDKLGPNSLKLAQTFPRKVLDGPDREKTLKDLNLVPSAALIAQ